jgi:hypothetical protein
MITVISLTVFSFLAAVIFAQAAHIMKAFSPAGEGMVRYVMALPQLDDRSVKL